MPKDTTPVEGDDIVNTKGEPQGWVDEILDLGDGVTYTVQLRTTKKKQPGTGFRSIQARVIEGQVTDVSP